jgi:hypothetical protein
VTSATSELNIFTDLMGKSVAERVITFILCESKRCSTNASVISLEQASSQLTISKHCIASGGGTVVRQVSERPGPGPAAPPILGNRANTYHKSPSRLALLEQIDASLKVS